MGKLEYGRPLRAEDSSSLDDRFLTRAEYKLCNFILFQEVEKQLSETSLIVDAEMT